MALQARHCRSRRTGSDGAFLYGTYAARDDCWWPIQANLPTSPLGIRYRDWPKRMLDVTVTIQIGCMLVGTSPRNMSSTRLRESIRWCRRSPSHRPKPGPRSTTQPMGARRQCLQTSIPARTRLAPLVLYLERPRATVQVCTRFGRALLIQRLEGSRPQGSLCILNGAGCVW